MLFSVIAIMLLLGACSASVGSLQRECNQASFVDHVILDVPVEEGTLLMPGMAFTKSWRLLNSGNCDWGNDYALVFQSGDLTAEQSEIAFTGSTAPGESLDISVAMQAPQIPASYSGEWKIRTGDGQIFGVGADGDAPLRVNFEVAELPEAVRYEFDQVHCLAQWHSGAASFLPCEGLGDESDLRQGYVRLNLDPALEGSSANNGAVLEVKGNNQQGGWIAGFFPGIVIEAGDHFTATIGCIDLQEGCAVVFHFEIEVDGGGLQRLASWTEIYDDQVHEVDVDLSEFAGSRVNFVLRVEEEGSGRSMESIAFWQKPQIEQQ